MAIRIYCEYGEFNYVEKEVSEYLGDKFSGSDDYEDIWGNEDGEEDDLEGFIGNSDCLGENASYYIVCDTEDEEAAEDMANYLGRFTKIPLEELHKVFFSVD